MDNSITQSLIAGLGIGPGLVDRTQNLKKCDRFVLLTNCVGNIRLPCAKLATDLPRHLRLRRLDTPCGPMENRISLQHAHPSIEDFQKCCITHLRRKARSPIALERLHPCLCCWEHPGKQGCPHRAAGLLVPNRAFAPLLPRHMIPTTRDSARDVSV